jgi:hypothetical protein
MAGEQVREDEAAFQDLNLLTVERSWLGWYSCDSWPPGIP